MSDDPQGLGQAERQMMVCIERIEEGVVDLVERATNAAQAKHGFEKLKAQTMMRLVADEDLAKPLKSAELRAAWVLTQPGMEMAHLEYLLADAVATSSAARLRALQAEGDLLRSVAKSQRDLAEQHGGRR